jgi:uncharacterized protein YciI
VFLLHCHDAPGSARPRDEQMLAHLAWIERHQERYVVAGPAIDAAGEIRCSVLIVRGADEADARALIEGDPYHRAGVWARVEVTPFRAVCGTAVGGMTWDPVDR